MSGLTARPARRLRCDSHDEAAALRPLAGIPPFVSARDLRRRAGADCAVEEDGNAYSLPWRLIGERVRVTVGADTVRVLHADREVAVHAELKGRHGLAVDDRYLMSIVGIKDKPFWIAAGADVSSQSGPPALLRSLAEYEAAIGGRFSQTSTMV